MGKISAVSGIVSFNPDLDRLRENVAATLREVDDLVIVDNNSQNVEGIKALLGEFPSVRLIRNPSNGGIAKALNQIMAWAAERGSTWALLLDQDSVVSPGMVASLVNNVDDGVAIVAPAIVDRSAQDRSSDEQGPSSVAYCITSGSLCSVSAWESIGGYDGSMFIDFVDFDFCLRLREAGFTIIREPAATLLHEIGKITRHGPLTAYHHSAFRSYHMARDMLYYAHKHRQAPRELMVQQRGLAGTYIVLARKAVIVALFEEDRVKKVSSIVKGIVSGTYALTKAPAAA
ncbi:MAG: glycosyltransferase family 2 protein [Arthrobacter sp.]